MDVRLIDLPQVKTLKRVVLIGDHIDHWIVYFLNGEEEMIHKTEELPGEYRNDYANYQLEIYREIKDNGFKAE